MNDEIISIPKAALDKALLDIAIQAGTAFTSPRDRMEFALKFSNAAMGAVLDEAKAYGRTKAAQVAARARHAATADVGVVNIPSDQPLGGHYTESQAVPSTPSYVPTHAPRKRNRRTKAQLAAAAAQLAAAAAAPVVAATGMPPAPMPQPFAPTPMPQPMPQPSTAAIAAAATRYLGPAAPPLPESATPAVPPAPFGSPFAPAP